MEIRVRSISEAHIKLCAAIEQCEETIEFISEDNETVWEYPEPVLVIIEPGYSGEMISPICNFGKHAMKKYANDLLKGSDSDFAYTYHDRLFKYDGVDQITKLIHKLKVDSTSRRAQAITWYPYIDIDSDNPPCLQRMQFMIRNGRVNMDVNFRSNDCLSAFNANVFAFYFLHKYVAHELDLPLGLYTHYITSAHLYPLRDAEELNNLKLLVYK